MKKYILETIIVILLSMSLASADNSEKPTDQKSTLSITYQNSTAYDAVLEVNGVVCDFCTQAIGKNFKKTKEIKAFSINMKEGLVSIKFANDKELTNKQLIRIINSSGYSVSKICRDYNS